MVTDTISRISQSVDVNPKFITLDYCFPTTNDGSGYVIQFYNFDGKNKRALPFIYDLYNTDFINLFLNYLFIVTEKGK